MYNYKILNNAIKSKDEETIEYPILLKQVINLNKN